MQFVFVRAVLPFPIIVKPVSTELLFKTKHGVVPVRPEQSTAVFCVPAALAVGPPVTDPVIVQPFGTFIVITILNVPSPKKIPLDDVQFDSAPMTAIVSVAETPVGEITV